MRDKFLIGVATAAVDQKPTLVHLDFGGALGRVHRIEQALVAA